MNKITDEMLLRTFGSQKNVDGFKSSIEELSNTLEKLHLNSYDAITMLHIASETANKVALSGGKDPVNMLKGASIYLAYMAESVSQYGDGFNTEEAEKILKNGGGTE